MIKLLKRKNIISFGFLKIEWSLFVKTSPSWVKIGPMSLEKKMYFRTFITMSTWKKQGPSFEQTWIPLPKDILFG